jgi:DNA (cytosine-5)-methyltransferase 1
MKTFNLVDLFCGAGGTSTGAAEACESLGYKLNLIAINHWDKAIETHSANHPDAKHLCANIELINPRELVEIGKLDLLVASPECTHFSNARGGRPVNDQSRATAWCAIRWAEAVLPKAILVENVPAFLTWGPLIRKRIKGKLEWVPDPKQKGETFISWVNNLESLGYKVSWKKLRATDYGDPTSRERLFIQARRDGKPIVWPTPTHCAALEKSENSSLFPSAQMQPYRTTREIIDWSIKGESIFNRKKPLSPNTLRKIFIGLQKCSGLPFIVPQLSGGVPRSVENPLQTITTTSRGIGLCEPYVVTLRNNNIPQSVDQPPSTICAQGTHHMLCEPFIVRYNGSHANRKDGDGRSFSVDKPLSTLDTSNRFGLVEPFVIAANHGKDDRPPYKLDSPFPTVTSVDAWGLIEPFIINSGGPEIKARGVSEPLNTILAREYLSLVTPYLVKYNGTANAISIDEPLDTVTSKDRFALAVPNFKEGNGYFLLDILYRMLLPRELAAAMSFPRSYVFLGNREQQVKQIGNAVPVQLAKALVTAILGASANRKKGKIRGTTPSVNQVYSRPNKTLRSGCPQG